MLKLVTDLSLKRLLCNFFDSFLMYKATCTKSILKICSRAAKTTNIMEHRAREKKRTTCKKKLLLWFRLLNWGLPYRVEWGKKCPFPLTKKRKTVIVNQNSGEREKSLQHNGKQQQKQQYTLIQYMHTCVFIIFFEICRLRIKVPSSTCFDDVKIMN